MSTESQRPLGGWRAPILNHFTPAIAAAGRLTVVVDEDALFTDATLLAAVAAAGFELLPSGDPMALRYAYETRVRGRRVAGDAPRHAVVVCHRRPVVELVPWDLLELARLEGRELAFGIAELFPQLAPGVVAELPSPMLDDLAAALSMHAPGQRLGEQGSREFVLRHVYRVAPELVQRETDLLRVLLRRHHLGEVWPHSLDARFIESVRAGGRFSDWPLERILPERDTFFRYIAERWPRFVLAQLRADAVDAAAPALLIEGPVDLPFGHDDVRVYLDTLFLEGRIPTTKAVHASAVAGSWMAVGVDSDGSGVDSMADRIDRLGRLLAGELPSAEASHLAWGAASHRYNEWLAAVRSAPKELHAASVGPSWRAEFEQAFQEWMLKRFAGLSSLPAFPRPVMVHQVSDVMARELRGGQRRVALVVLDGLSGSQWSVLRASLSVGSIPLSLDEDVVFAWVPTVTSVSRQAIFAGEPPMYFSSSIGTTGRDEARWRSFWSREGLSGSAVAHIGQRSGEPDSDLVARVLEAATHPPVKVIGITVTSIDRMVHGTVGGERGLHAQVEHWARDGHLRELIQGLVAAGYAVHLTSDHGNAPAEGMGRPNVGDTPEVRGERVLVFPHSALRATTAGQVAGTIPWSSIGLPDGYFPLLAPLGKAFTNAGAQIIGHGGISIEEVVVPYVRFVEAR